MDISKNQKEILNMVVYDNLTPKQISNSRGVSVQAVYKTIKKLRKKGFLDGKKRGGLKKRRISARGGLIPLWRYHKLHLLAKPYYIAPFYHKIRKKKGNYGIPVGNWVIRLHRDAVRLQLKRFTSFDDEDEYKAIDKAEKDIFKTIYKIENDYRVKIIKERKANVRIVEQHFAKTLCDFAGTAVKVLEKRYITIRRPNGKIRLQIDYSRGDVEREHIGETAIRDAEKLEPYLNDIMDNDSALPSQMEKTLKMFMEESVNFAKNMNMFGEHIRSHTALVAGAAELIENGQRKIKELKQKAGQEKITKYVKR